MKGIEAVGFALNDEETPHGTDYRYMAVWKFPSADHVKDLEEQVADTNWRECLE